MKLIIHTDGGARGNPGKAAVGVYIQDEKGRVLAQIGKKIGETTNNVAEYTAVIEALLWIKKMLKPVSPAGRQVQHDGVSAVEFYLDSTLVAQQLNRMFQIKLPHLKELALQAWELENEIGVPVSYHIVRREQNQEADRLVNEALDGNI